MHIDAGQLRRTVVIVATLNFSYVFVEVAVALAAGSISLLADSVDFLEETASICSSSLRWAGHSPGAPSPATMALIIAGPAALAAWTAIRRFSDPVAPDVLPRAASRRA